METIERGTRKHNKILLFTVMIMSTIMVILAAFAIKGFLGWLVKIAAFLLTTLTIWIGISMLKGKTPPSLTINSKGIRSTDFSKSFIPWQDIKYITKNSPYYQSQAEKFNSLTEEEVNRMSGQEYSDFEYYAKLANQDGIYVGVKEEEISLTHYFTAPELDFIYARLQEMLKSYKNPS